jgi:FAD:protein FMN transferase
MTTRSWRDWSCGVRLVLAGTVPDAVAADAVAIVRDLMADVERAVSRFRTDSELERVNRAAPRMVPVDPLTLALVGKALEAARLTDGAVDPTVGRHLTALGYDGDIVDVRSRVAPAPRQGRAPSWSRVTVDRALGRVGVARGLRLDLGATAKAWAADDGVRRVVARHRVPSLLGIGGDVAVSGRPDEPWLVRVSESEGGPGPVVGLTHGGIATSSTTARRWPTATGEAHHVIDPATGRPTDGRYRTATVWAPTALLANTYSTAALVWGDTAPARLALAGADARLVDRAGAVREVGAWPTEGLTA